MTDLKNKEKKTDKDLKNEKENSSKFQKKSALEISELRAQVNESNQ